MKILLVGAGGYGTNYANTLLKITDPSIIWEGVVDNRFSASAKAEEIKAAGIPVYTTMEEFYRKHTADLAIICTPPFLHREHSICALSHGSYVLCEKPAATTLADAEAMLEAEKRYGKWIAVGYQWSYEKEMQELKKDIMSGALGRPLEFKAVVSWPRDLAYYGRGTGWAGRISKDGITVLDSIASNACAHYLHNMLFLLGDRMDESAEADGLEGCCYRANDIESFDTCSIKMLARGVPMYLIASHAAEKRRDPEFVYLFENAKVVYTESEGITLKAIFGDGTVKSYGELAQHSPQKIWGCINAIREGTTPICTVKTSTPHTRLIKRIHEQMAAKDFPRELVVHDESKNRVYVKGLYELMYRAYDNGALLSELMP